MMDKAEHRAIAEAQLAEAEETFDKDRRNMTIADAIYSRVAHLRQCAMVHAILSKD
jgi:hypothetical protein